LWRGARPSRPPGSIRLRTPVTGWARGRLAWPVGETCARGAGGRADAPHPLGSTIALHGLTPHPHDLHCTWHEHTLVRLGAPRGPRVDAPSTSTRLPCWSPPYTSHPTQLLCTSLLDHLVRLEQERRGEGEAERLGRLEVDDQVEFQGLLHGQVPRLGAVQNLVHIGGRAAVQVPQAWPIGQEPTRFHKLPPEGRRWPLVRGGELQDAALMLRRE